MITKPCDKCRKTIRAPDEQAGQRLVCPECGDVNVMPGGEAKRAPDRAEALGLPPDSGPEVPVLKVRVSMLGNRPLLFLGLCLVAVAGPVAAIGFGATGQLPLAAVAGLAGFAAIVALIAWKITTYAAVLEISNKRTILRRGLLSRSMSEVAHDNIRNVQIYQSFWNRIWRVGKIGISSSGQDGIEVEISGIPRPDEVRRTIDAYRPL